MHKNHPIGIFLSLSILVFFGGRVLFADTAATTYPNSGSNTATTDQANYETKSDASTQATVQSAAPSVQTNTVTSSGSGTYEVIKIIDPRAVSGTANYVPGASTVNVSDRKFVVEPMKASVAAGGVASFKARLSDGSSAGKVYWSVLDPSGGKVSDEGFYYAPLIAGTYRILARSGYGESTVTVTVGSGAQTVSATNATSVTASAPTPSVAPATVVNRTEPNKATTTSVTSTVLPPGPKPLVTATTTLATTSAIRATPVPDGPITAPNPQPLNIGDRVATTSGKNIPSEAKPPEGVTPIEYNPVQLQAVQANASTSVAVIDGIAGAIKKATDAAEAGKAAFLKALDDRLSNASTSPEVAKIIRDKAEAELLSAFGTSAPNPDRIKQIRGSVEANLNAAGVEVPRVASTTDALAGALNLVAEKAAEREVALKGSGADLLFKDSNGDGISDFESVNLYRIDPVKPAPVTVVEGKTYTAEQKILEGYDPSKEELVKVVPQDARTAFIPATESYKVTDIKLDETKKIVLKGQALPNSFVTIYIYSTPITVVVKTNAAGEWNYTLDKELEDGEHKIYTASVDNTGNIVAKSSEFAFVKTAEAATLGELPASNALVVAEEPRILDAQNIYLIVITFAAILIAAIAWIGVRKSSIQP